MAVVGLMSGANWCIIASIRLVETKRGFGQTLWPPQVQTSLGWVVAAKIVVVASLDTKAGESVDK